MQSNPVQFLAEISGREGGLCSAKGEGQVSSQEKDHRGGRQAMGLQGSCGSPFLGLANLMPNPDSKLVQAQVLFV